MVWVTKSYWYTFSKKSSNILCKIEAPIYLKSIHTKVVTVLHWVLTWWRIWQYMMYISKSKLYCYLTPWGYGVSQIPRYHHPPLNWLWSLRETGTELISSTFKICFFLEWYIYRNGRFKVWCEKINWILNYHAQAKLLTEIGLVIGQQTSKKIQQSKK